MLMEEVFKRLRSLQDILARKIEIEKELQDIPKGLSTQEELLQRLKKAFQDTQAEHDGAKTQLNESKTKLFEAEQAREKAEKQMDAISTQREYEALDKEIRDASEKEQSVRKDIQHEEKALQEIETRLQRDELMISQIEQEVSEKRHFIETKSVEKRSDLEKLGLEEADVTPGLDPEVVFKFERIIRSKQGLGIVPVIGGVCSGCHMILPSQFVNEVREGTRIIFCPYCSRILFYQEAGEGEEESYMTDIESGGLSDLDDFDEDDDEDEDDEGEDEDSDRDGIGYEEE